jgi:hypothetical protein
MKKILYEPGFLILLAGNAYCLWYFANYQDGFATVIWIYWIQSVIIGIFNFLDILTIKNYDKNEFRMNSKPGTTDSKGCTAWFFLLHYGAFHFAYFFFLAFKYLGQANGRMVMLGTAAFFIESIISFRRKKEIEAQKKFNLGTLFFLPYLRIIPMHLTIIFPAFMNWKPSIFFLLLKTLADVILYFVTRKLYSTKSGETVE